MKSIKSLISTLSLIVTAATVFTGCLPPGYTTGKVHGKARFKVSESQISGFGHVTDEFAINSRIEVELKAQVLDMSIPPNQEVFLFSPNSEGTIEVEDQDLNFVFNGYVLWAGIYVVAVDATSVAATLQSALSPLAAAGVAPKMGPAVAKVAAHLKKGKGKFNKALIAYGIGRPGEELPGKLGLGDPGDWECINVYLSITIEAAEDGGDFLGVPQTAGDTLQFFTTEGPCGAYTGVGLSSKKTKIHIDVDKKPKKP